MESIKIKPIHRDYIILYRLIIIILYTISSYLGYFYLYPNDESMQLLRIIHLWKYFTCITMTLNAVYFITTIPLQYFNHDNIRSYQFLVVFTFNMTMMLYYWGAFFYDPKIISDIEDLINLPLWYNNLCHIIPPITLIIDAWLCHPKIVSFYNTLKIVGFIGIIYNLYLETGILLWNTSPYPEFLKYTIFYRYLNYALTWSITIRFILLGKTFVTYLNKTNINKQIIKIKEN